MSPSLTLSLLRWLVVAVLSGLWLWITVFNGWVTWKGAFRRGYRGPSIGPIAGTICAGGCCLALVSGDPHRGTFYLICFGVAAILDMGSIPYLLFAFVCLLRERNGRLER